MKNKTIRKCLLALTLLLGGGMLPIVQARPQNITTQLPRQYRAQTDTIEVQSQKMQRAIKNVVVVPSQYYEGPQDQQYPVLYLLHGAGGAYDNWSKKANLELIANRYGMIIVCPDGQDSWYFDSPIDPAMQFETYVSSELVSYVDSHYRTFNSRHMRAITGLSMGGHGALWLAFRHPQVFGSCGSMSGGVDISRFPGKWNIAKRLGDYQSNHEVWKQHTVVSLVPTIKSGQNIAIDEGSEDFFYEVNCNLHELLMKHKIAHEFTIRPGGHTWAYWVNALDYQALFFDKAFKKGYANMLDEQQQRAVPEKGSE